MYLHSNVINYNICLVEKTTFETFYTFKFHITGTRMEV